MLYPQLHLKGLAKVMTSDLSHIWRNVKVSFCTLILKRGSMQATLRMAMKDGQCNHQLWMHSFAWHLLNQGLLCYSASTLRVFRDPAHWYPNLGQDMGQLPAYWVHRQCGWHNPLCLMDSNQTWRTYQCVLELLFGTASIDPLIGRCRFQKHIASTLGHPVLCSNIREKFGEAQVDHLAWQPTGKGCSGPQQTTPLI